MKSIFERGCDQADAKRAAADKRGPDNPRIVGAMRLLADDVSIERAWHELNRRDRAAASTVEALMFSLRRGGVGALARHDVQVRLSELLDLEQVREVCGRVQNFKQHIAPPWSEADVGLLIELVIELRKPGRG
jgi:hypothetical protein